MPVLVVFRKINTVKVKFKNVYAVNCSQNKLRIREDKNLSGTAFTEAASKVTDKLHKNVYELLKKAVPQISLAKPRIFYNPDKEYWFGTVIWFNKDSKLGYHEFDTIDASKEMNRQVTEIGVRTLSKGATGSLIKFLDYPGLRRESFLFGLFQVKSSNLARCLSNILATKRISHNVVEDIKNEFWQCGVKTVVSDKERFDLKKINCCLMISPGLCKPLVVRKAIVDTYGVYPLKYQNTDTYCLHKNKCFDQIHSKISSYVFMGINHKLRNTVHCNCKHCLAKAISIRYEQNSYSELIFYLGVFANEVYKTLWQHSSILLRNFQKLLSQCCRTSFIAYWMIFHEKINLEIMASFMKHC